jgi:hypothetical protein
MNRDQDGFKQAVVTNFHQKNDISFLKCRLKILFKLD